ADSFDVALVLDVLEHLVERRRVLDSVRNLLRPGGRLIVAGPHPHPPPKRWRRHLGAPRDSEPGPQGEVPETSIPAELEDAGFRVERLERGGYDTPFGGLTSLVGVISLSAYSHIARRRHELLKRRPQEATAFRVVAVSDGQPCGMSTSV